MLKTTTTLKLFACCAWCVLRMFLSGSAVPLSAASQTEVSVLVGKNAPPLERHAAQELCQYLWRLFGLKVEPKETLPSKPQVSLLVGSPATNPADREALRGSSLRLGRQGIALKRVSFRGQPALVIAGGSPASTLWAVYELVERWGGRYLLHGDVLPPLRSFELPDLNLVLAPKLAVRQWRVANEFAAGPISWGMADYRPMIDQLAKLKFNRLFVYVWPHQPFLDYAFKGVQRQSATLFFGFRFPITDDMVGRNLFGNAREFWNPDLPLNASYSEFVAAGVRHIRNLIAYGKSRGMEIVTVATLTEYPKEFAPLIEGSQTIHQLGALTSTPGAKTGLHNPNLAGLASTILRATVNTYPEADFITLGMPEHRQWTDQYETAWQSLDKRYGISQVASLPSLISQARQRKGFHSPPERAEAEVKGDLVNLYFYDQLLHQQNVLKGTLRPDMKFIFGDIAEELFPVLPRILPRGSELLNFVDYTPSRIVRRREVLKNIPGQTIPSTLIYTLHDDNVGFLPQLATGSLHELTKDLRQNGWAGFSTRYWLIGDHDPCIAYLSRAAWDENATPEGVYRDQLRAICGERCVEPMLMAWRELELATIDLEAHGLGFGFPVEGMMMKHWTGKVNAELDSVPRRYRAALEATKQAQTQASKDRQGYFDYWIGRFEFGIGYFDTVNRVHSAAAAEKEKDPARCLRETQAALEAARWALESYARVAQDQSDRGAIAMMNEYIYRPLKAKVQELKGEKNP